MEKINLRNVSEVLSDKELKNVLGGEGNGCDSPTGKTCEPRACVIENDKVLASGMCVWYTIGNTKYCVCKDSSPNKEGELSTYIPPISELASFDDPVTSGSVCNNAASSGSTTLYYRV